jgi:glycosyltransferase involved in cell wall biosynthesis
MRIALVSIIRPRRGSGDGITEYAYELYSEFRKRHRVDLVYSIKSTSKNNVLGLAYTNLTFNRKIAALAGKDYDIIHIVNHEIGSAAKLLKRNGTRAKVVTTVHDLLRLRKGYTSGALQSIYNRRVLGQMRDARDFSDFVIFVSSMTRSDFARTFGASARSCVVPDGVGKEFLSAVRAARGAKKKFRVGYIGSLAYHKNVGFVLRVAERLRDPAYEFHIYGSGVQGDDLRRYAEEKGLANVHFHGFLDEDQKIRTLDSFDAFIFPTLYEGFGMPILEAQARGLPVIIFKGGRVPGEVGRHCLKARDAAHAAGIIASLREKGYDKMLKARSISYARRMTWASVATKTLNIYKQLLEEQ